MRYLRHQYVTSSTVVSPGLLDLLEAQTYHDFFIAWALIVAVLSCLQYFKVFCTLTPVSAAWLWRVTLMCVRARCSSSSSSQVFLEWPKQQRHHEDHCSQSKYSRIRECSSVVTAAE